MALPFTPPETQIDANRDKSGTSRLPSAGTPVPVCHEGLGYPPAQLELVSPVGFVQLLTPPLPAMMPASSPTE